MSDKLQQAATGDAAFSGCLNLEDMDINDLLKQLYKYRSSSELNMNGGVISPFRDIPRDLMHQLDGYFLAFLSN